VVEAVQGEEGGELFVGASPVVLGKHGVLGVVVGDEGMPLGGGHIGVALENFVHFISVVRVVFMSLPTRPSVVTTDSTPEVVGWDCLSSIFTF